MEEDYGDVVVVFEGERGMGESWRRKDEEMSWRGEYNINWSQGRKIIEIVCEDFFITYKYVK